MYSVFYKVFREYISNFMYDCVDEKWNFRSFYFIEKDV